MIVGSLFQTTSPLAYIPMIVSRLKPFDPAQLNPDVLFDPSDLSSVFVNRAGYTAATAGSPVGMILDKSKGLQEVTLIALPDTGTFNPSGTTPPTASGNASHLGLACRSVTFNETNTAGYAGSRASVSAGLATGLLYRYYEYALSRKLVGSERFQIYFANGSEMGTTYLNADTPLGWQKNIPLGSILISGLDLPFTVFLSNSVLTPVTVYIRQIKVTEKLGNHAVAPTDAARPTLARMPKTGRRNLLTYTDLRNSTVWRPNSSPSTVISEIASEGFTKVEFIGTSTDRRFPIEHVGVTAVKVGETVTFRGMFKPAQGCTTIALGMRNSTAQWAMLAYDIVTKTTSKYDLGAIGTGTLISAIEVQSGVWELVVSFNCTAMGMSYAFAHFGTGGAVDLRQNSPITSCEIGKLQFEMGSIVTPYQKVTNAFDVTEAGVPSIWPLELDGVDDVLNVVLTKAINGFILIAGTKGTIIEPVSYAAGSTLSIGTTTYTGGTAGILSAVGGIIGVNLFDRNLTELERNLLIDYYKGKGAKGLLDLGPELVVNGTFDTSIEGWTAGNISGSTNGILTWVPTGAMNIKSSSSERPAGYQGITTDPGKTYLISAERVSTGSFVLQLRAGRSPNGAEYGFYNTTGILGGPYSVSALITPTTEETYINISPPGTTTTGVDVDNVSVRELRPQEDWV